MLDHWIEWIRVVNLSFALTSFIHLLRFYKRHRQTLPKGKRDQCTIWIVISGSLVVLIVDAIRRDAPVTIGTLLNTTITVMLVQGIYFKKLWPLKGDEYEDI